ncbi:MAG: pantoate--beta-alanine ligase [Butyricimonas faecihominis]
MSSRNTLLKTRYRKNAPHIHKVLEEAAHLTSQMNVEELKKWVVDEINKNPYLETEYFEIVDNTELKIYSRLEKKQIEKVGCLAVYDG